MTALSVSNAVRVPPVPARRMRAKTEELRPATAVPAFIPSMMIHPLAASATFFEPRTACIHHKSLRTPDARGSHCESVTKSAIRQADPPRFADFLVRRAPIAAAASRSAKRSSAHNGLRRLMRRDTRARRAGERMQFTRESVREAIADRHNSKDG